MRTRSKFTQDARRGAPDPERFWKRVDRRSDDECWVWIGHQIEPWLYGRFYLSKARGYIRAHRYSYELNVGLIPDGMLVLHRCDNPPCVNPAHLRIGTHEDNMADKVARGRSGRGVTGAARSRGYVKGGSGR